MKMELNMKQTFDVEEGNKLIAEFMGGVTYPELRYHFSWGWLMPVIRKIVELCIEDDDLFMSDYYTSILETVPLAIIDESYKTVVEFIKWYNTQNNE